MAGARPVTRKQSRMRCSRHCKRPSCPGVTADSATAQDLAACSNERQLRSECGAAHFHRDSATQYDTARQSACPYGSNNPGRVSAAWSRSLQAPCKLRNPDSQALFQPLCSVKRMGLRTRDMSDEISPKVVTRDTGTVVLLPEDFFPAAQNHSCLLSWCIFDSLQCL